MNYPSFFNSIHYSLFGKPDEETLDNYLVRIISFLSAIIGLIGAILNLYLHLTLSTTILTLLASVSFTLLYWFSRGNRKYRYLKHSLVILSILSINLEWVINYGTKGPTLYLFVVIQSFIMIMFSKWARIWLTFLIFINVSLLFFIEYHNPEVFGNYNTPESRLIDIYWGMLIYLSLSIFLLSIALGFYIRQKERAEEADRLKSSFLANMSHEIRTPMNAIIGFSTLLQESQVTEKQKKYINVICENGFYLLNLINDIIDISKIEVNQFKIVSELFGVKEMLDGIRPVIHQFLMKHGKQHLQLVMIDPPEDLMIYSDQTRLKQVLTNLLSNAVKFTEHGSIIMGCKVGESEIQFEVSDTGIGISAEAQKHIFNRFHTVDNNENEMVYRGAGIGLSITKQIVELMGGQVDVESNPGKGSRFCIRIPTTIAYRKTEKHAPLEIKDKNAFSGEIMLIAEDEDTNYIFLEEVLSEYSIKCIRAHDGLEAIQLCESVQGIRLVLMDIKMPRMNGLEATIHIKKKFPHLPVIAQTAFAMKNDEQECLRAGCDDYISKPVDMNLLLAKIRQLMR